MDVMRRPSRRLVGHTAHRRRTGDRDDRGTRTL